MKRGLNFNDVNKLKLGLAEGWGIEEIAQQCFTYADVIQKYIDSMPPEEIEGLRSQAPAHMGAVDLDAMREQIKNELREEMGLPTVGAVQDMQVALDDAPVAGPSGVPGAGVDDNTMAAMRAEAGTAAPGGEQQELELSPQQRAANTRKRNAEMAAAAAAG